MEEEVQDEEEEDEEDEEEKERSLGFIRRGDGGG